jgi:isochorismate synthase
MGNSFQKCRLQLAQKLPFVIFRKPNANAIITMLQADDSLYHVKDYREEGFIFAPFDGKDIVLIPKNKSAISVSPIEFVVHENKEYSKIENENELQRKQHITLVESAVNSIKKGDFDKVVLSRKECLSLTHFDLFDTFQKLAQTYPTAFAYCFYHPKVGLWLGAFSEQLLFLEEHNFRTMSVAGTQVCKENTDVVWGSKEVQEQELVTTFLVSNLSELTSSMHISDPYTMQAGNVAHIKTAIDGTLNEGIQLKELLSILHPTPAVCGFPKAASMDFILRNEGYDRSYYSGFLGELNFDFETKGSATDLYVNLRCMEIEENNAYIYVGGGITIDSHAESEWLETVNKSQTMKKILY